MKSKLRTQRRRLFFDIETSPNIGLFFKAGYKLNISYESIIKERAIICICYKWEDDTEVRYLTWDENQSDKIMLQEFIKITNEADELVGHNGDKFDLAWIRTRCLFNKVEMFPTYTTIDTLKISRSKFNFNSNKLDYISKFLGLGKKIKTDYNLWKEILLDNNKKSLEKMVKYCQNDVKILEKVFKAFRSHLEAKSHFGVVFNQDRGSCPECGSDDLIKYGVRVTRGGARHQKWQCRTCGIFHAKLIR